MKCLARDTSRRAQAASQFETTSTRFTNSRHESTAEASRFRGPHSDLTDAMSSSRSTRWGHYVHRRNAVHILQYQMYSLTRGCYVALRIVPELANSLNNCRFPFLKTLHRSLSAYLFYFIIRLTRSLVSSLLVRRSSIAFDFTPVVSRVIKSRIVVGSSAA
jgi:hypothetical protein